MTNKDSLPRPMTEVRSERLKNITLLTNIEKSCQSVLNNENLQRRIPGFVINQIRRTVELISEMRQSQKWDQPQLVAQITSFSDKLERALQGEAVDFEIDPYNEAPASALVVEDRGVVDYRKSLNTWVAFMEKYQETDDYKSADPADQQLIIDFLAECKRIISTESWGEREKIVKLRTFFNRVYDALREEQEYQSHIKQMRERKPSYLEQGYLRFRGMLSRTMRGKGDDRDDGSKAA